MSGEGRGAPQGWKSAAPFGPEGSADLAAYRARACLIIGDMPNGEGFFRQTRQIFAGILSYGKKM